MRDIFSPAKPQIYDGVRYGHLTHLGQSWLFGASTQNWAELLPLDASVPKAQELAALARKGLWLGRVKELEPLALVCQGMGSLWPGAGRELYDDFPRAREAMDQIASVASWDVLALLDCRDREKISATRWQIPYLFLLEYAQWSYLTSLGLSPSLICGHSLGELIALCFAGIYTPEIAWHILDKHAEQVASLEAQATEEFSMLAVHAHLELVEDILAKYPKVRVVNYNTPSQFILGGPKPLIREIRSILRKQRIPAVAIAVSMLFHHPTMRVLRNYSLFFLNKLVMHAPSTPVLSVCKCQPYPDDQATICQFITDLDENPVRFSDMLTCLWQDYGVRSFVELGPQEVLCGLIKENLPEAEVMSPARKGHEARGLRELCARLYAEGRLREKALAKAVSVYGPGKSDAERPSSLPIQVPSENRSDQTEPVHPLFLLLSELTGLAAGEITPELDLRKDLALRSSSFPHFLAEAEKRFHTIPSFADLVGVVTVGDLLRLFTREDDSSPNVQSYPALASRLLPLASFVGADGARKACYAHPFAASKPRPRLGLLAQDNLSDTLLRLLLPDLLLGLPGLVREICLEEALFGRFNEHELFPLPIRVCQEQDICACDWLLLLGDVPESRLVDIHAKPESILHVVLHTKQGISFSSSLCLGQPWRRIVIDLSHGRRRFYELGDFLARELALGRSKSTYWLASSTPQADDASCASFAKAFWLKDEKVPPLLVPMPQSSQQKISELAARVFFDPADPVLAGQGSVTMAFRLLPLLRLVKAQTPWLDVLGFTDLCDKGDLELRPGIVREGFVRAHRLGWLSLEGQTHRKVDVSLSLACLRPNGRKVRDFCEQSKATVLLGQEREVSLPDWVDEFEQDCQPVVRSGVLAEGEFTAIAWGPCGLVAEIASGCLAQPEEIPYIQQLYLLQEAVKATLGFLHCNAENEKTSQFAFSAASLVLLPRWNSQGRPRLFLRRTFSDALRERFDAVVSSNKHPLVLISQMEFVKAYH